MRNSMFLFAVCVLSRLVVTHSADCSNCRKDANQRNCQCDQVCAVYGDCCIDAPAVEFTRRLRNPEYGICLPFEVPSLNQGAYMISTCSSKYHGPPLVAIKCRDQNDVRDPLWSTPVTNTLTGATYRNRFCAECNNVAATTLQAWGLSLECDSLGEFHLNNTFVKRRIHYRTSENSWGMYFQDQFHACRLIHDLPSTLASTVRLCKTGLVDTCPKTWRHIPTRRRCEKSYVDIVYSGIRAYRNAHCAFCNGVAMDRLKCENDSIWSRRLGEMSFALLMDMNFTDSNEVGKKCPSNEVFDPFYRKCRSVVCALPGFRVRNGKCHRI